MIRQTLKYSFVLALPFMFHATTIKAQNQLYRYTHMGNQRFHRNKVEDASKYYMNVLKKDASNTRALFNLANVYLSKGDVKAADSLYNKVTQTETNAQVRSMAWHNRGVISQTAAGKSRDHQQQLLRTAIEQYKQSLRLNPHDERTRYNLALCQKQLKDMPPQNNNKQQQKQQQQQQPNNNKQNNNNNKQQQPNKQQEEQQNRQQTEQYMNLAKQAERRALERLKQHQPQQRARGKNW